PALPDQPLPEEKVKLVDVLWSRVQKLPEDARRLLEVLVVAGQPLQQADACLAAGVEANQATALAHLRSNRHVLSTNAGGVEEIEICHDRLKETILAHLTADTARDYHGRLAEVLQASVHTDPEVLAGHFHKAGNGPCARLYFRQ